MNKLTSIVLSLVLVLVLVSAAGTNGSVLAHIADLTTTPTNGTSDSTSTGTKTIHGDINASVECDTTEWHFQIDNIQDASLAPASITWFWNGGSEEVTLQEVSGNAAHYFSSNHLDKPVTDIQATIFEGWEGAFTFHHGPCAFPSPVYDYYPTYTPTPTEEVTPTPTVTVTPTEGPTATPTEGPKEEVTPTPTVTVLGVTTMAKAGAFEQNLMNLSGIFGMLFVSAGSLIYGRIKKII